MIYSATTIPVNPAGVIRLTRDQVWQALERKARDARPLLLDGFCTHCDRGEGYRAALLSTLKRAREMLTGGKP